MIQLQREPSNDTVQVGVKVKNIARSKRGETVTMNSTNAIYKTQTFSTHMETTYSVGLLDKPVFDG